MAGAPWTDAENDLIVADYFAMLAYELAGAPFMQARHNRAMQAALGRSQGAIEFKRQNISAALRTIASIGFCCACGISRANRRLSRSGRRLRRTSR